MLEPDDICYLISLIGVNDGCEVMSVCIQSLFDPCLACRVTGGGVDKNDLIIPCMLMM